MCGGEAASMWHTESLSGYQTPSCRLHRINSKIHSKQNIKIYAQYIIVFLLSPQFIFEFLKGAGPKGSIAIDDMHIIPGPCDSYPTSPPPHHRDSKYMSACYLT